MARPLSNYNSMFSQFYGHGNMANGFDIYSHGHTHNPYTNRGRSLCGPLLMLVALQLHCVIMIGCPILDSLICTCWQSQRVRPILKICGHLLNASRKAHEWWARQSIPHAKAGAPSHGTMSDAYIVYRCSPICGGAFKLMRRGASRRTVLMCLTCCL